MSARRARHRLEPTPRGRFVRALPSLVAGVVVVVAAVVVLAVVR